jgi:hypothetical protein
MRAMLRPVPTTLVALCVLILFCSLCGLLEAPLRFLASQDFLTLWPLLLSVPLCGIGVVATVSVLGRHPSAYERIVLYGNVYRGVALLSAVVGLVLLCAGLLGNAVVGGFGCATLGLGTLGLVWYRVIRYVMHRKEVLEYFGVEAM